MAESESSELLDVSSYEGGNMLNSEIFRTRDIRWISANLDMREWKAFWHQPYLERGPSKFWFHVPSVDERQEVSDIIEELGLSEKIHEILFLPKAWKKTGLDTDVDVWEEWYYLTRIPNADWTANVFHPSAEWNEILQMAIKNAISVRWFRNSPIVPTTEWKKMSPGGWWRLPHEYQEVEYIESTGTQWIDSWYIPKWTSWFEMKFRNISAINTYRTLIWTRTDTSTAAFWIWWMNSKCYMEMSPANIEYTRSDGWFNTGIDYEMSFLNKTLICNWETFQSWTNFTQDSARNLYIFSWNSNWQTQPFEAAASRMYYLKLYEWENLVRDFVPCYRVSDWAAWLYDLVEWKFYANSWTWTFKKWAPVNAWQMPSWYTELAYIGTTWSQFIDTGLSPTSNLQVEAWVRTNSTANNAPVFWNYINNSTSYTSWNYYHLTAYSNKFYWGLNNSESNWGSYSHTAWNWYYLIYNDSNSNVIENWTVIWSSSWATWYTWTTIAMARRGSNSSLNMYFWQYEYYYFKIYDKTQWKYVCDFVPCVRDSDWVIWMYDLITKQFFTNSWTGNFVAWPAVFRNGFIPSYRTVWYFPLVDNVDDIANWLSLTTSWTKEDLWRTFTATTTFSNRESTKPTKFISVFLKINSWLNGTGCCTQLFDLWETPCCYVTSHSDSSLRNTVHYSNWSSWPHAWTGIVQWQWFHLCYWYYGWTINMRVNGIKTTIWGGCVWTSWWNDFIRINGDWLNITCSDYIMETEWWTDEQVADYLNAKKALYWIS